MAVHPRKGIDEAVEQRRIDQNSAGIKDLAASDVLERFAERAALQVRDATLLPRPPDPRTVPRWNTRPRPTWALACTFRPPFSYRLHLPLVCILPRDRPEEPDAGLGVREPNPTPDDGIDQHCSGRVVRVALGDGGRV